MSYNYYFTEKSSYDAPYLSTESNMALDILRKYGLTNEVKYALGLTSRRFRSEQVLELNSELQGLAERFKKMYPVRYALVLRKLLIDALKLGFDLTNDLRPEPKVGQVWLAETPFGDYSLRPERLFVIANVAYSDIVCFEVQCSSVNSSFKIIDENLQDGWDFYVDPYRDWIRDKRNLRSCITTLNNENTWRVANKLRSLQDKYKESYRKGH